MNTKTEVAASIDGCPCSIPSPSSEATAGGGGGGGGGNNNDLYDLFAVLKHNGGLHSGHYTSIVKHPCSKKWYCFNDAKVWELKSEEHVVCRDAYILWYKRRR